MSPPAKRDGQKCEKLQKVPYSAGLLGNHKVLESANFLCELPMFHLAAGQPCFMGWQNRKTALRGIPGPPSQGGLAVIPKKGRRGREERESCPT